MHTNNDKHTERNHGEQIIESATTLDSTIAASSQTVAPLSLDPVPPSTVEAPTKPNRVRGGKNQRGKHSERAERKREFNTSAHAEANKLMPNKSETALLPNAGIFYEGDTYSVIEKYNPETKQIEEFPIIERSLTTKQFLRFQRQVPTKGITLNGRQYDKRLRRLVVVSDPKVIAMSDRTLLKRGNPFKMATDIKRETSISKRIELDPDTERYQPFDRTMRPQPNGSVDVDTILEAMQDPPKGKRGRSSGKILSGK
jgi:hypothetical protein